MNYSYLPIARFLLWLWLLLFSVSGMAVQVDGLYDASVPVPSQSVADRDDALAQALEQVLIKVSGDSQALASTGANRMLAAAEKFVVAFSYTENPDYVGALAIRNAQSGATNGAVEFLNESQDSINNTDSTGKNGDATDQLPEQQELPRPFLMEVSFAQSAIERELAQFGVPIWGRTRPLILVWLVDEERGERMLHGASATEYADSAMMVAEKRGLPAFFPVIDLTDMAVVDPNDVWGLFPAAVEEAAGRYGADINLLVRLNRQQGGANGNAGFQADWSFRLKNLDYTGSAEAMDMPGLWQTMWADISRILAERYAVQQGAGAEPGVITLEIGDVNSFGDYAELQKYLQTLPSVVERHLLWVNGSRISYRLNIQGQREQFYEYLELGGKLKRREVSLPAPRLEVSEAELFNAETTIDELSPPVLTEYFVWNPRAALKGQ